MKLRKLNHRTTALVLAFLIIFVSIPAFATAYGVESNNSENSEPDVPFSFTLEEGDLPFSKLKTAVLDPADIPDVISPALCAERDHVNRLYAQEPDDYTVMFQNRDGSKTTYIFSKPVKSGRSSLSVSALGDETEENAFTYSSDGLEYRTRTQLVSLDRLDKNCIDGNKVYYYNIGYAEITKTGSRLTSSGTDITEEVREWSRGKVTRGGRCAGSSGAVINEEAPGTYVLMYTASEMAGIVNLKNYYSQTYLKNNSLTPVLVSANPNTLKSPSFRWVLQYCNYGRYIIKSMVNINSTQYLLKYNSNFTAVSISSGSSAYQMWKIDEEEDGDGIMYYYLRPAVSGGSGKGLNNSLGFSNVTTGSFNDNCGWELLNKRDIATSISPVSSEAELLVCDYFDLLTTTPSNAELFIDWTCDVPSVLEHDEEEETWYFNSCGVFKLWYHDYYSGLETDSNEDIPIIIYVKDRNVTFSQSKTYIIRAVEAGLVKPKTLSLDLSGSTPIFTVKNDNNPEATSYHEQWDNYSRSFTFSLCNNTTYIIGATRASDQYHNSNLPLYTNDAGYNNDNAHLTYILPEIKNMNNYIGYTGSAVPYSLASGWHIIPIGQINNFVRYIIARNNDDGEVFILSRNSQDVINSSYYSYSNQTIWSIYELGNDVPLIKQTKTYYCGYATLLQTIYGAGTISYLQAAVPNNPEGNNTKLAVLMEKLRIFLGYTGAMDQNSIHDRINSNSCLPNNVFDRDNYEYKKETASNTQIDIFRGHIVSSLSYGWSPFIRTGTGYKPYKYSVNEWTHYISIVGYDQFNDKVIIANCHYLNSIFGIYSVDLQSFKDNTIEMFYAEEIN